MCLCIIFFCISLLAVLYNINIYFDVINIKIYAIEKALIACTWDFVAKYFKQ